MKSIIPFLTILLILACQSPDKVEDTSVMIKSPSAEIFGWYDFDKAPQDKVDSMLAIYTPFELTTDISKLSENEISLIKILMEAGSITDGLFWKQAYGDKEELINSIKDQRLKAFATINYGPWDRLNGNKSFIDGIGEKPAGANFYPLDMDKEEFETSDATDKSGLYNFVERGPENNLITIPYHKKFDKEVSQISALLSEAAELAENNALKKYLSLRAKAIKTDDYQESDMAWLDMKDNKIDVVIGPIENYEDQLYGYKAAYEAYVLVKDMEWSERLAKYGQFLPELQKGLPVADAYKQETPGSDTELNAYDVIWYSGDCNAGSKTIAINLPNDEEVQLAKGTRRLQLKNAMKAKFDKILTPIADMLVHPDQRGYINFDAFFANTMFHEVAHGLGIKNTIDGSGTVRKALKEHASALEEGKADMLGLYMINQLHEKGEIEGDIKNYIVTFMAGIFRSVRFGASSAHGKANMIRFNFFDEYGAFTRDTDGYYKVDFNNFQKAMDALSEKILTLQGDGDYAGVARLVSDMGSIKEGLQADLDRLSQAGIPVDVVFRQGPDVLGI
jgi:hypothetical protein